VTSFFSYLLCFGSGVGIILFGVKRRLTPKQKEKVIQLQTDKRNLQIRNSDLAKLIQQNQEDIKDLKEAVAILSGQIILSLEIMAAITRIREQVDDINAEIIITRRFQKKYSSFLKD